MSCGVFYDKTFVPSNAFQDIRFLDRPSADICPLLLGLGIFFFCMRRSPPRLPVICELLKECSFDTRGLLSGLAFLAWK